MTEKISNISTGIHKMYEYEDVICFSADCSCSTPAHAQTLSVDYDEEINDLTLTIYSEVSTLYFNWRHNDSLLESCQDWVKEKWCRVKMAAEMLWKGYLTGEVSLILRNEKGIEDYILALHEGLEKVRARKIEMEAKFNEKAKEKKEAREALNDLIEVGEKQTMVVNVDPKTGDTLTIEFVNQKLGNVWAANKIVGVTITKGNKITNE